MADWFDDSKHPLHVMQFPAIYEYETLDRVFADFEAYYRDLVQHRPQEQIALLVDISRVEKSNARNRKRIADAVAALAQIMEHHCVGQAYVVEKPIIRAALTAVLWLKSSPWPVRVFKRRVDSEEWLFSRLAAVETGPKRSAG